MRLVRVMILALALLLSGCSTLASKEATIACQAADVASTMYALKHGAVEANPFVARLLAGAGFPGLVLAKIAVVWMLFQVHNETVVASANVGTCAVAAHNVLLVR